jgi:hypothetical protein
MRSLAHRGQALLFVLVGGLVTAVVCGAALECFGLPEPVAARASGLLGGSSGGGLPNRIEIGVHQGTTGIPAASVVPGATPRSPSAGPTPSQADGAAARAQPAVGATVIPAAVYTYPPDDHGGRNGGGGSGGGGSGRRGGG